MRPWILLLFPLCTLAACAGSPPLPPECDGLLVPINAGATTTRTPPGDTDVRDARPRS